MPTAKMEAEALIAMFEAKAAVPPPESSQMLVRHVQCKESLKAAQSLTEALNRFAGSDDHPLSAPSDLLAPPM